MPAPPDRTCLEAYLAGRLDPEEAHAVERRLEADPLLREALEGLRHPEAGAGLAALDRARPSSTGRTGMGRPPWYTAGAVVGMVLLAGAWLVLSPMLEEREERGADAPGPELPADPPARDTRDKEARSPAMAEIAAAEEQPEPLRIGHREEERPVPVYDKERMAREPGPEPLHRSPTATPAPPLAKPIKARRPSRQLLFPHDLKLVHPAELYPYEPGVDLAELNVQARYGDRRDQQAGTERPRPMRYTTFMGTALGEFARNDHKACLEDLLFLLEQYPEDVNGLFYAGLCSYNLALYGHARTFLHKAATHPVDSFEEEATWYHALTLERLGEMEAAQEAFARIVTQEGFYAGRARARLDGR